MEIYNNETLKTLPSVSKRAETMKAKKSVTFPVNVTLHQAIVDGDKEEIKKLINKLGKNVLNLKDPNGMPLLLRAIYITLKMSIVMT